MIKSLRLKFIGIAMVSMFIVLICIIGAINVVNYIRVNNETDQTLQMLVDNRGKFPKKDFDNLRPEKPFITRYFTVIIKDDYDVYSTNMGQIAAISNEEASDYAVELYKNNQTKGFVNNYKYKAVETEEGMMYVFLDCGREIDSVKNFLYISLFGSFVGLAVVFFIVYIWSKIVFKPVAESYEKQKRFITDASHDIKTPLAIIDANTEVIEIENGESEWTNNIKSQIGRLNELTEHLVMLSRLEENHEILNMKEFSLSEAVENVAHDYMVIAKSKEKLYEMDIQKNIYYHGDEKYINKMMSLLLDNAMKYSNEHGHIWISLKKNGKFIEIIVKNTVDHISIGSQNQLFDRFYRADQSRNSNTGGFGIGLSVVKSIVDGHKGKIEAVSEDGKSLNIKIKL